MRCVGVMVLLMTAADVRADDFTFSLREQVQTASSGETFERRIRPESWPATKTAFIVCDVWDKHHSLNAVRRLEEFVPRLNEVLTEARRRGAVIIHAPSDCMPGYVEHPARMRAVVVPAAVNLPPQVEQWCSRIPTEELASYPIDQSDGGDDDDPGEHATWAAELVALGRNPGLPWQAQHPLITIDDARDYMSDRGDEVWNILEHHGIEHVVLTGVHTNMCVIGRPFGLRRMVAGGRQVVLMRDLTDCMYNPARWPFVDHFTGNDLIVSHIERYVCPTITSDQVLGGEPFRFQKDQREQRDMTDVTESPADSESLRQFWNTAVLPGTWSQLTGGTIQTFSGVTWYRCTLRLNAADAESGDPIVAVVPSPGAVVKAWINGQELKGTQGLCLACAKPEPIRFRLPRASLAIDDANLFVLRTESRQSDQSLIEPPSLIINGTPRLLSGRWQLRIDDKPEHANMPLPAKFGSSTDIVFGQ